MSGAVYVNGRITPEDQAVVPVFDHGFLYGEGVYEVCRNYRGRPLLIDRHLHRLRASAGLIALSVPHSDGEFETRISDTMAAAGLFPWRTGGADAYIRLLLTRGVGELTYDPAATPDPRIYENGVSVSIVSIQRNAPAALNPLIKSNNLLNNALAMQRALASGGFEAVMRNARGELAECSQSNLFVVSGGVVRTPPLESGLLAGITRQFVLELCGEEGIAAEETTLHDADLLEADEVFITSSTREIVPVVRVDHTTIGSGKPGATTTRLIAAFRVSLEQLCPAPGLRS